MVDVPLREYLEALIRAERERTDQALASAKEAISKAEASNERRLALLNEFRSQAADESQKYAMKDAMEQALLAVNERIVRNASDIATLQGRSLALAGFGALLGSLLTAGFLLLVGA